MLEFSRGLFKNMLLPFKRRAQMQNSNTCDISTSEIRKRKRILVPMSKPRLYIFTLENLSKKRMRNGMFFWAHEFWRFRLCLTSEGKGSMIQNNCCFPHYPENVWLSSDFPVPGQAFQPPA